MYITDNVVIAGDQATRLFNSFDVRILPHNSDTLKLSFIYNGIVICNTRSDEIMMATDVIDFNGRYKGFILNLSLNTDDVHLHASWLIIMFIVDAILYQCLYAGLSKCVSVMILLHHVPYHMKLWIRAGWESSFNAECFNSV